MAQQKEPLQFIRVTHYVDKGKYRKLKSILALEGISISEFLRQKIDEKLGE